MDQATWIGDRMARSGLALKILYYGFGSRMDVESFVDSSHVAANAVNRDAKMIGDFLIAVTGGQLVEKSLLARRQMIEVRGSVVGGSGKMADHPPRDLGGHRRAAGID